MIRYGPKSPSSEAELGGHVTPGVCRGCGRAASRPRGLRTIFVVESPLDAAMAPEHGSPHDLALRSLADVVARGDGPQAITVHRLRW